MIHSTAHPREGDLYRVYRIGDHTFEIRYGYYEENERGRVEPLPIFPNLKGKRLYSHSGHRIVTSLQQPCEHYCPKRPREREDWCGDCIHYAGGRSEIGICSCEGRRHLPEQEAAQRTAATGTMEDSV